MRNDSRHSDHNKENRAQCCQCQTNVRNHHRASFRMQIVRENGLHPEVNGAQTEAAKGAHKVDHSNVGLLKIANNAATETRSETDPQ